jgi:hypothetical protein
MPTLDGTVVHPSVAKPLAPPVGIEFIIGTTTA